MYVLGGGLIRFDLFSQPVHVLLDEFCLSNALRSPDLCQDGVRAEHLARVPDHQPQYLEFFGRKVDASSLNDQLVPIAVQDDGSIGAQEFAFTALRPARPVQPSEQAADQFRLVERLDHKVIRAYGERVGDPEHFNAIASWIA